MNYSKTVDSKPLIADKNGNTIRDLTSKSLKDSEFTYVDAMLCPTDFAMRPELIAHLKLGNVDKLEVLLKGNAISNPFAVDENDLFLIPEIVTAENKFETTYVTDDPNTIIKKQYIDSKKVNIKNTGDNYKDYNSNEKTMLPPNYAKDGETEFMLSNGKIILSQPAVKTMSETPLEKEIFIAKITSKSND